MCFASRGERCLVPSQSVLTTDQLVSQIASSLQISKPVVRALLQELAKTAIREFKKNGFFVLPGIGRLVRSHRMARMGRNPRTGEAIKIPAPAIAKFHVDAGFAKLIQGSSLDRTLTSAGDDVELKKKAVLQPKASNQGKPKYEVVRIFYATDREAVPGKRLKFSSRRNDSGTLSLGTCDVSIPRDHRVGNIERPSILRIGFRENPDKHFVIQSITTKGADDFYGEMSQCVGIFRKKRLSFLFTGSRLLSMTPFTALHRCRMICNSKARPSCTAGLRTGSYMTTHPISTITTGQSIIWKHFLRTWWRGPERRLYT